MFDSFFANWFKLKPDLLNSLFHQIKKNYLIKPVFF